ncbi:MAG: cobalamin-dependent protein [Proteobacteria bacterium]|nr:cobalamin-dependent protein [Pseudomonadota bacterium]
MDKNLTQALVEFDEDFVLADIEQRLAAGEPPMTLVRELQEGMRLVGEHFESGRYYLSELMMSADLFTRAMAVLEPHLSGVVMETIGRIVIGTPKGDIHDIGKNIFCTLARSAGFEVHDLGVDVPVDRFTETIGRVQPDVLAFSALLTTTFESMKAIVDWMAANGWRERVKVIVGGGVITETVKTYIGADGWTRDALDGLNQCRSLVGR